VGHEVSGSSGLALTEEWDIVCRIRSRSGESKPVFLPAPENPEWSRTIKPDEILLFRFSALTFNGHRIHYDRRYAGEEGYPGLVVHGPFIAICLLDLLRRNQPEKTLSGFSFRAVKPLFDGEDFAVSGRMEKGSKSCKLWAADSHGNLAMEATATFH
jgi:3-methylfumaryl-CoA hydratase